MSLNDKLWMLGGGDNNGAGTVNPQLALYQDAGMPIAWSEYSDRMALTASAFYSDGHHTPGADISNDVLVTRNLFINRTFSSLERSS